MKIFKYNNVLSMKREFSNLEKFYCTSACLVYEVHINNGKLAWNDNGTFKLCDLSPRWLLARYTLEKPSGDVVGATVEEIFFLAEFHLATEFKRVGSTTRFRIQRGVLEYFSTKFEVWLPRTIDKGVESLMFILNPVLTNRVD